MINPAAPLRRHRRAVLIVCITIWVAAFGITHIPASEMPPVGVCDVTLHTIGYFGIAAAFWLAIFAHGGRLWKRPIVVIATLAAYGAFDEITQPLVNRCAALGDWLADVVGVLIAVCLLETIRAAGKHFSNKPAQPA